MSGQKARLTGIWLDWLPADQEGAPGACLDSPALMRMALIRLPGRTRQALRSYTHLTGQRAVVSLVTAVSGPDDSRPPPPPIHPLCRETLLGVNDPPCADQWQRHLDRILADQGTHSHVCPLGLQCSCIPIYLRSTPVGVAKLVMSAKTSREECASATATLALAVTLAAQGCYASVLRSAMAALGGRVHELARLNGNGSPPGDPRTTPQTAADATGHKALTAVQRMVEYVHEHYQDPDLSLLQVAAATDYHPKYLSHLFARTVGTRLRTYLCDLRVNEAARLLLGTPQPVKEIAHCCGFRDTGAMNRVFRRRVGVSPGAYRRVFTHPPGHPTA